MTDNDTVGGEPPADPTTPEEDRYGALEIGDGQTIIYDRDHPAAWLQSDVAISLEA